MWLGQLPGQWRPECGETDWPVGVRAAQSSRLGEDWESLAKESEYSGIV